MVHRVTCSCIQLASNPTHTVDCCLLLACWAGGCCSWQASWRVKRYKRVGRMGCWLLAHCHRCRRGEHSLTLPTTQRGGSWQHPCVCGWAKIAATA